MYRVITDLDKISTLAAQKRDDLEIMRYMLQKDDDIDDTTLDALVKQIAAPVIEAIDCTQCANCCRNLHVYLTPDDAERLENMVNIPLDSIIDHDLAAKVEEWGEFRHKPCHFLNGKVCSIYPHRPESCRMYPVFTPDFRWTLEDTIAGAGICPIIYNVLVQMLDKTEDIIAGRLTL